MPTHPAKAGRQDAARNREQLIAAARVVFSVQGPDAPLEEIARTAQVSRTTLFRHFATRADLAVTVFADNVAQIERHAEQLDGSPTAVIDLFHFVLDMQMKNPALARALSRTDTDGFRELSSRTATAFAPLIERARIAGVVHAWVDVTDLMRAFPMAAAVIIEDDVAGRTQSHDRIRLMLDYALFSVDSAAGRDH